MAWAFGLMIRIPIGPVLPPGAPFRASTSSTRRPALRSRAPVGLSILARAFRSHLDLGASNNFVTTDDLALPTPNNILPPSHRLSTQSGKLCARHTGHVRLRAAVRPRPRPRRPGRRRYPHLLPYSTRLPPPLPRAGPTTLNKLLTTTSPSTSLLPVTLASTPTTTSTTIASPSARRAARTATPSNLATTAAPDGPARSAADSGRTLS